MSISSIIRCSDYNNRSRREPFVYRDGVACAAGIPVPPHRASVSERHRYGNMSNYMMRRRWGYFVKWLADGEPPKEYGIKTVTRPVPSQ